jgi:spermidine/putrescine-binding protein
MRRRRQSKVVDELPGGAASPKTLVNALGTTRSTFCSATEGGIMSNRLILATLAFILAGAVLAQPACADDKKVVVGIVSAAATNAEEAAVLTVDKVIYKITKDKNGKTVASEADGKKVEIKGNITIKDQVKWIAVTSCKIVE